MQIVRSGSFVVLLLLAGVFTANAQEPSSAPAQPVLTPSTAPSATTTPSAPVSAPAQSPESLPPAAATLNQVIDRVVQREHLFIAQMRHMHPMVETYIQT
jgi:hypothetical protein